MAEPNLPEAGNPSLVSQSQDCRHRLDPVDIELMRARVRLTPAQRLQSMLDARELVVGLIRGRLQGYLLPAAGTGRVPQLIWRSL